MDVRNRQIRGKDTTPFIASSPGGSFNLTSANAKSGKGPVSTHGLRPIARYFSHKLWLALIAYWLVLVHLIERLRVTNVIDACQWEKWENWPDHKAHVTPHRIALIADPQLVDDHTYPSFPRVLNYLIRRLSDNYLFINYKALQESLAPDTTIFIGDLFDGGRDWEEDTWVQEYHRFNRIFPEYPGRVSYRGLPGNHDIGFQTIRPAKAQLFASYFGEPNAVYLLGNHSVVQLDTISLSHNDTQVNAKAREFLEYCKTLLDPSLPRIFLTHVPLYRDPGVEVCAPGRESQKRFPLMRGIEYQTVIEYPISEDILKNVKPVIVFSGDDHDYCDTTHIDYSDHVSPLAREISCKTISMTNGIKRPAVQLLSLNNPRDLDSNKGDSEKTYETTMCYLPSPYFGIKVYLASLVLSFAILYLNIFRSSSTLRKEGKKSALACQCFGLLVAVLFLLNSHNKM